MRTGCRGSLHSPGLPFTFCNVTEWGPRIEARIAAEKTAKIIGLAEHRLRGKELDAVKRKLSKLGWRPLFTPACIKEVEPAGGTALLVRSHLNIGHSLGTGLGGQSDPGVIHGPAWTLVRIRLKHTTVLLGCVYFESAPKQPSRRNAEWLHTLAAELSLLGLPFLLIGDWNMVPEHLFSLDWRSQISACVRLPDAEYTCRAGNQHVIDFAVASTSLAPAIGGVAVDLAWPCAPHLAIRTHIAHNPRAIRVKRLARPKPLPPTPVFKGSWAEAVQIAANHKESTLQQDLQALGNSVLAQPALQHFVPDMLGIGLAFGRWARTFVVCFDGDKRRSQGELATFSGTPCFQWSQLLPKVCAANAPRAFASLLLEGAVW